MPSTLAPPVSKGLLGDLFLGLLSIIIGLRLADGAIINGIGSDVYFNKIGIYFFALLIALFATKSWQYVWRWTSSDELLRVTYTIIIATFIYSICTRIYFNKINYLEPLIVSFIMASLMMGARGFARLISSGGNLVALSALFRPVVKGAPSAILIGPTDIVTSSLHELRKDGPLPIRPVAIISTSGNHIGKAFSGARVYDGSKIQTLLPRITESALIDQDDVRLILVGDQHTNIAKQSALDVVSKFKVKLSRMPEIGSKELSNVNPQDVLGRKRHVLREEIPAKLIRHKTVLITGAGGTIGSELARQVAKYQPGRLILVESSENNLYTINQSLSEDFPTLNISPYMVDVRDKLLIDELFSNVNPQIVIHAAANKHVPLLELHPREAIRVNLGGTKNVADASLKHESEVFILISTDKAVNPSNMMGAAKRAAELYIRNCFEKVGGRFYSVRFGNVLGSSGSVMPLFERQISKMGPVTVTHRDMTRWFMTVEEAVGLVLQGAALGAGVVTNGNNRPKKLDHPLLVLDMGEPIRIWDFAETMIRLSGYEPHTQIKVIETGSRPGEKLHEELFYSTERVQNTAIDGIYCAKPLHALPLDLEKNLTKVIALAEENKIASAIELLKKIVPEVNLYSQN